MQENRPANFRYCRVVAQPFAIFPMRTKGLSLLYITLRMSRHPFGFGQLHRLQKFCNESGMTVPPFAVFVVSVLSSLFGVVASKAGEVRRRNVTQVAHNVHYFVT